MLKNKIKTGLLILLTLLTLSLTASGCGQLLGEKDTGNQDEKISKRFQEGGNEKTAVESAINLSEKYSRLSEEHSKLKGKYENKVEENRELIQQKRNLQAKLKQTEKELKEANTLLKETVTELNRWKFNVLGFQQEVRNADEAQLKALYKILKLMGGEPPQPNDITEPNQVKNQSNTNN